MASDHGEQIGNQVSFRFANEVVQFFRMAPGVLILDDDESFLDGLRCSLSRTGWRTSFATSIDDAQELFQQTQFDVVVSDLSLHGESGADFIRDVHAAHPQLDIVVMSGCLHDPSLARAAQSAPLAATLEKPIAGAAFVEKLTEVLDMRSGRAANEKAIAAAYAALDHVGGVMAIIRARDQAVLYANARAKRMFESGDVLSCAHGRLKAADPRLARRLHETLKLFMAETCPERLGKACLQLADADAAHARIAGLIPLTDFGEDLLVALAIDAYDQSDPVSPDMIARALGLTHAETRLALALSEGLSVKDAAHRQGVTEESARTYLKRIFNKTGVHRQAELALIVRSAMQSLA